MGIRSLVVLENVDISASGTTQAINLENYNGISATASFTGTPRGSFKLQAANEKWVESLVNGGLTWIDIPDTSVSLAGVDADFLFTISNTYYRWIRGVYDAGVGSAGYVTFIVNLKEQA